MTALCRVVVADDDAPLRVLFRRLLERSGRFQVVGEACNGEEAIAMVRAERPDLALLDLAMPVVDGLEATRQIRQFAPETRIAIVSGFDSKKMEDAVREAGADVYIEKQLRADHLIEQVLDLWGALR
jgi:DNA-binding NarL/FixJ family response regulator